MNHSSTFCLELILINAHFDDNEPGRVELGWVWIEPTFDFLIIFHFDPFFCRKFDLKRMTSGILFNF